MTRGRRLRTAAAGALCLGLAACGPTSGTIGADYDLSQDQLNERGGGDTTRLVVGSKNFAEQEILGHITLLALQAANAEVVDQTGLGGSEGVRNALLAGEIDMYWEYTGTAALLFLPLPEPPKEPDQLYQSVAEEDLRRNDIAWLEPAPADNSYAVAVRQDVSGQEALQEIATISDLADLVESDPDQATICVGPEFEERVDGLPGLEDHYGFEIPERNVLVLPDQTVYSVVAEGSRCAFGSVFQTSGFIEELGLRLLEDDQDFFLPYNPALTVRAETLERYPALEDMFATIAPRLTTEVLRELSRRVLVEHDDPADVARDWLQEEGLID